MNHNSQPHWMLLLVGLFLSLTVVPGCSQQSPVGDRPGPNPGGERQPGSEALLQHPEDGEQGSAIAENREEGESGPGESSEQSWKSWPRPELAIVITGRQHGYLEPCGCTGLDYQKGGLARRQELIRQLREDKKWPLLMVDAGNQVRRFGRQPEIKFQLTIERLKDIGYQAIALGPDDLRLPAGELVASIVEEEPGKGQFMSANVSVIDPDLMPAFRVVSVGKYRVGITSVLGDQRQQGILSDDLVLRPAAESLRPVVEQLETENCDFYLLLVQASMAETRALARQFPLFSYIITSGGVGDPPPLPEVVDGIRGTIIEVGPKGMFAGVLGLYPDREIPWRYSSIGLDAAFPDSDVVLEQLKLYQQELERAGLEGLGIRPVVHSSGASFVGSQACAKCHLKEFTIWSDSPHAQATDALVHPDERSEIPRHHDPECLSCHVTGWNPQKYYPYKSGFLSLESTPLLVGNGCENCHGPGSLHVAAESGETDVDQQGRLALQFSIRLTLERAKEEYCFQCHDLDNSPEFHTKGAFEGYWEQIAH
tara:strand:+ start:861 stop:2477 length:1617 start_codon:yes stop_codon:yes gene_type:complete